MSDIEFIREQVPEAVLYAQLAEEAAELANAALKMFRILDGRNPTPVRLSEAMANLMEEIVDVKLCIRVLGYHLDDKVYDVSGERKLQRWANRLKEVVNE